MVSSTYEDTLHLGGAAANTDKYHFFHGSGRKQGAEWVPPEKAMPGGTWLLNRGISNDRWPGQNHTNNIQPGWAVWTELVQGGHARAALECAKRSFEVQASNMISGFFRSPRLPRTTMFAFFQVLF